ncbi:hypothetical protein ACGFX4_22635 [Kitasatospora sp. NPDC048365]|uniref:hypothetical protein n=1 Tax=Kitasatospora sp. NPDC048365 TaxID=3364050 RepID=UPI00371E4789
MYRPARRAVALAAAALLLLLLPGSASAAGNGSISTTMTGVPGSLPVGGSFTVTMTVRSTSQYRINVTGFYLSMWNFAQQGGTQDTGITVLWNDPATGAWRSSDHVEGNGGWSLNERERVLFIEPHGSMTVRATVTFGPDAARGTVHVLGNGVISYSLMNGPQYVYGTLDSIGSSPTATFRYGGGAAAPAPTTRSAAPKATASRSAAAVPSASRAAASPSTASPSAEASPSPSPSPSPSTTAQVSPSPSASAEASVPAVSAVRTVADPVGSSGGLRWPLLGGLVALVGAGGAVVAVLVARARRSREAGAGNA